VHPELCDLVPIYKEALQYEAEAGGAKTTALKDGLRAGAETWSLDGRIHGRRFPNLTEGEVQLGYTFLTIWPTMYIVAHADYIRQVNLLPLGPEKTQLTAEWLFPVETLEDPAYDLTRITRHPGDETDAEVCEPNQRGSKRLNGRAHAARARTVRFPRMLRGLRNRRSRGETRLETAMGKHLKDHRKACDLLVYISPELQAGRLCAELRRIFCRPLRGL
jgi:Rieske 2Fe-2S family protein